jgi:hypothetical protein
MNKRLSAEAIAQWAENRARRPQSDTGISRDEQWQIVQASRCANMTLDRLAAEFGRTELEVARVLAAWTDSREAARQLLKARALELADRMMTDADPGVALEILERLQVVEMPQATPGLVIQIGNGSVNVNIGQLQDPSAHALPAIDGSRDPL